MKKTLFLAILAGAALAGCVKNEEAVKSDGSPERITFDAPVVSVPTRATEIYGNYPSNKDFAVYAIYHKKSFDTENPFPGLTTSPATSFMFMTDVQCKADNTTTPTTWKPVSEYYWPKDNNAMLTFGAYAPARIAEGTEKNTDKDKVWDGATVGWDENGFTFTDFKVLDQANNQIDLLYSDFVKDQKKSSVVENKPYDGVTIPFKHALSSIVFTASTSETGNDNVQSITITKIKVKNVANKGTFKQKVDEGADNWTVDYTTLKDYEVYNNSTGFSLDGTARPVNGSCDGENEKYGNQNPPSSPNTESASNDGTRRSDLIVIPQILNGGAVNNGRGESIGDAIVEISYTIVYVNPKDNKTVTEPNTAKFNLLAGSITASDNHKWKMGMRYIYDIQIGLNEINFNPQVYNWVDVENSAITEIQ